MSILLIMSKQKMNGTDDWTVHLGVVVFYYTLYFSTNALNSATYLSSRF